MISIIPIYSYQFIDSSSLCFYEDHSPMLLLSAYVVLFYYFFCWTVVALIRLVCAIYTLNFQYIYHSIINIIATEIETTISVTIMLIYLLSGNILVILTYISLIFLLFIIKAIISLSRR